MLFCFQYPEPNRPWPPGGSSPAPSPGPGGGHPLQPASPHHPQHAAGPQPSSSPSHAPSPSPQPSQASPSPHQVRANSSSFVVFLPLINCQIRPLLIQYNTIQYTTHKAIPGNIDVTVMCKCLRRGKMNSVDIWISLS